MNPVPAGVIDALGGLEASDPPVLYRSQHDRLFAIHASDACYHNGYWKPSDWLFLPASSPALLRLLARAEGLKLEDHEIPRLIQTGTGWALVLGEPEWRDGYPRERIYSFSERVARVSSCIHAPTLGASSSNKITDPTRALAELVCWRARLFRARRASEAKGVLGEFFRAEGPDGDWGWCLSGVQWQVNQEDPQEALGIIERWLELEPWRVEV